MSTHTVSRRDFLRTAGAAVASGAAGSFAQAPAGKTLVYMGCYTARGQGIYIYEMNVSTGELGLIRIVGSPATVPNPSFLALSPHGRYLYSVNEIGNYQGRQSGSITAFAVDYANANLTQINVQPTEGRNPAHLKCRRHGTFRDRGQLLRHYHQYQQRDTTGG